MRQHWIIPPDATIEERQIVYFSILNIYNQFSDPIDKLIIMGVFELGYPQKLVAEMVGRREQAVCLRIKKIKTILNKTHKAYIRK